MAVSPPRLFLAADPFLALHLSQENILARGISEALTNAPIQDHHGSLRTGLKAGAAVVILASLIPYKPIFSGVPASPIVQDILFTAASVCYFVVDYGFTAMNLSELWRAKSRHEYKVLNNQNRCYLAFAMPTSYLLAAASQIPSSLPVLVYFKDFYGMDLSWPGFLDTIFETSLVTWRSNKMAVDDGVSWLRRRREVSEEDLFLFRKELISLIEENEEHFSQLARQEQLDYRKEILDDDPYKFLANMKRASSRFQPSYHSPLTKKVLTVFQYFLATFSLGLTFWYSETKMREKVLDNQSAAVIISLAAVGLNAKVIGSTIYNTSERIINFVRGLFKCRQKRTMAEQISPKWAFLLKTVGLLCNFMTLSSTWVIWRDFGNNRKLDPSTRDFFISIQCAQIFGMLFTSTMDAIENCLLILTRAFGTKEEKDILHYKDMCQRIKQMITLATNAVLSTFRDQATDEFKALFVHKMDNAAKQVEQLESKIQEMERGVQLVAVMPAASVK